MKTPENPGKSRKSGQTGPTQQKAGNKNAYRLLFYNAGIDYNHWNIVKFIIDNIILVGLACTSGLGLLWMSLQNMGAKASPVQATQMMNRGKHLILDVRDAAEFGNGHLSGAKNIPLADLEKRTGELDKFKALPVIVVCQSGNLAARATSQLQRAGFEQAVTLEGGLTAWLAAGLPTTRDTGK